MPRQNFLNREAFLEASELQIIQALKAVSTFATHISFQKEDRPLQSFQFNYNLQPQNINYTIKVSILFLNEKYTRVCLHGEHYNGEAFMRDHDLPLILHDVEAALTASLSDNWTNYQPLKSKLTQPFSAGSFTEHLTMLANLLFLRKNYPKQI